MLSQLLSLPGGKNRNEPMEGLRGYAAGLIFLTHFCGTFAGQYFGLSLDAVDFWALPTIKLKGLYWLFRSHYGVELFFVLSGFLVFRMTLARQGRFEYLHYVGRRVARIYPAFLVSLAACTILLTSVRSEVFTVGGFVKNVLLLNGIWELHVASYNPVTSSLTYEFVFYLLCPAILLFPARSAASSKVRMAVAGYAVLVVLFWLNKYYLPFILFFAGGLLAVHSDEELRRLARAVPDALVAGVYLLVTTVFVANETARDWSVFIPMYFGPSVLLVLNACYGDGFLSKLFRLKWLRLFGNISYSFYLIHLPCLLVTFWRVVPLLEGVRSFSLKFAILLSVSFAFSFAAASLLFLAVEKGYFYVGDRQAPAWRRYQVRLALPAAAMAALLCGFYMYKSVQRSGAPLLAAPRGTIEGHLLR